MINFRIFLNFYVKRIKKRSSEIDENKSSCKLFFCFIFFILPFTIIEQIKELIHCRVAHIIMIITIVFGNIFRFFVASFHALHRVDSYTSILFVICFFY